VADLAERLGISPGTIYDWIRAGKLHGRRGPGNRLNIPFGPEVEQQCRGLVANSVHLPDQTKIRSAGGAV
jgi:excisionase family DNA binding protein